MPQKVVARVGLSGDTGGLQPRGNPDACAFSVCDCVDDFAAAIGAVAAREIFWIGGLARGPVDNDAALLTQDFIGHPGLGRLSDRQNQQIDRKCDGAGKFNRLHCFAAEDACELACSKETSRPQAGRARTRRKTPTFAPGRAGR